MKRFLPWLVGLVTLAAGCAHNQNLERPETQDNYGVRMAKENLWREAMFRFQRAVEIAPGDARAHNNLAVAYEANGDFEKARKEYLEALKLDRSNQYIQKNYSRYVEFLSRNRKRQPAESKSASTTTTTATTTVTMPPATDASAPAPPAQPPAATPPPPHPPGGAL